MLFRISVNRRFEGSSDHSRIGRVAARFLFLLLIPAMPLAVRSQVPAAVAKSQTALPAQLLQSAQGGNSAASLQVGVSYHEGQGVRRDGLQAVRWLSLAVSQGSIDGKAWLGDCFVRGWGTAQNIQQGTALILAAAQANSAPGLRFAGILYDDGLGVSRNYAIAISFYQRAGKMDDAEALDRLGLLYLKGLGVPKSPAKAVSLLRRASALGNSWAQLHLAEVYEHRIGDNNAATSSSTSGANTLSATNLPLAMGLLASSAQQSNRVASYELAMIYLTGPTNVQNTQLGMRYLSAAAYHRYVPAQIEMGDLLMAGKNFPANKPLAFVWYSLAADQQSKEASGRLSALASSMSPQDRSNGNSVLNNLRNTIGQQQPAE